MIYSSKKEIIAPSKWTYVGVGAPFLLIVVIGFVLPYFLNL